MSEAKGGRAIRLNLTVPGDLRARMEVFTDAVNWSAVASEAFRVHVLTLESEGKVTKMTKMDPPKKQKSGGARMRDSGKIPVLLGLTASQRETIRSAAESDGRPVTQFLVFYGLLAAKKILGKLSG